MSLQGQIEELGLGAIIQTLSLNRYRGTLRVETEYGSKFVFISEGEIEVVRSAEASSKRLGDLLVRAGKLTQAQLDTLLDDELMADGASGDEALVGRLQQQGLMSQEEVDGVVRQQIEEEFLDLFLLDRGRFEFIFGLSPEALFAPGEKLERVRLNAGSMMMEAMRRLDELQSSTSALGSLDTIYRNRMSTLGARITEYQFEGVTLPNQAREELYELVDGTRSLREVLAEALKRSLASRLETFTYLHHLNENGLIKPMDSMTLLTEARKALERKDVPGAARYIRAILGRKEKLEAALVTRYIEFLRKMDRPRMAFSEAKVFAARFLSQEDLKNAIKLYGLALELQINVEVIDRLFYALLQANKRERAIQVGLLLREHLGGEQELEVATRIVKNLEEIDPENPEVVELSGLVHARREEHEEALEKLERALRLAPERHPRRREIMASILKLDSSRKDLATQLADLDVRLAREQLRREFRRRVILAAVGPLALILIAFLGWRYSVEQDARVAYNRAKAAYEASEDNPTVLRDVVNDLRDVVAMGYTSIRSDAQQVLAQAQGTLDAQLESERKRIDLIITEQQQLRAAEEAEAARQNRLQQLGRRLDDYLGHVAQDRFAEASRAALEIHQEYAEVGPDDPRWAELAVFVGVATDPPGATASVGGVVIGATPVTVPIPVGGTGALVLRLPGYRKIEDTVAGSKFDTRRYTFEAGPSWTTELPEPPSWVDLHNDNVLLTTSTGIRALSLDTGNLDWEVTPERVADVLGVDAPGPATTTLHAGETLIACDGERVLAISTRTGDPLWLHPLPDSDAPALLGGGLVDGAPMLVIVRGDQLWGWDPLQAPPAELVRVRLPHTATHAPGVGGDHAFVPLEGGRVSGINLKRRGAFETAWTTDGLDATDTPRFVAPSSLLVPLADGAELLSHEDGVLLSQLRPEVGAILGFEIAPERGEVSFLGRNGFLSSVNFSARNVIRRRLAPTASGGPVLTERGLFIVDNQGRLLAFTRSGRPRDDVSPMAPFNAPLTHPLLDQQGKLLLVVDNKLALVEPPR